MLFRPRCLSILTTRRCTAACDHCCVGASPRAADAIPIPRIHALIDEAVRIPSIEMIGFTGGECFLLGHALDELVEHATANAFRTRVVSNGYWAVHARAARDRIATLRAAGLGEMMLSTGTFHERFVPVQRIVWAARAAAAAGVVTRVSIEACDQSAFDDALLREELAPDVASGMVVLARSPWLSDAGGRGTAHLSHAEYLAAAEPRDTGRCAQALDVISVTPGQELLACCGFPAEQLPRLRIGSVADRSLDGLLASAPNELLTMWLHVAGPSGIASFVAKYVDGYTLPRSASICEACVALQRDDRAMQVIAQHGAEIASLVAANFIRVQSDEHRAEERHTPATRHEENVRA